MRNALKRLVTFLSPVNGQSEGDLRDALIGPDGKPAWHELICHRDTPSDAVRAVRASLLWEGKRLYLSIIIDCHPTRIRLPAFAKPYRTDGLWQHTCFELFHTNTNGGYTEYNFSPSSQWAAYSFDDYRKGMTPFESNDFPPSCAMVEEDTWLYAMIRLSGPELLPVSIALSAVIEETDGTKSYWALRHPPGPPDFHHPDCFALTLEAPPPS